MGLCCCNQHNDIHYPKITHIVKKNLEVEMVCCDNALFGQTMAQYAHTGKQKNDIYNP